MNTYYIVTAKIDGLTDELFGSFDKNDCKHEIECSKESWLEEGYKCIKITTKELTTEPSKEVYDNIVTSKELFMQQASNFNFEYDEQELLSHALDVGFVTKVGDNKYMINTEY